MPISATLAGRLNYGSARRWSPYERPDEASGRSTEAPRPPRRFNPATTRPPGPAQQAATPGSDRQSQIASSVGTAPGPAQKATMIGSGRRSEVAASVAPAPAGRRPARKMTSQKAVTPGSDRRLGTATSVPTVSGPAQEAAMVGGSDHRLGTAASVPTASGPAQEAAMVGSGSPPEVAATIAPAPTTSQKLNAISNPTRGQEKPPAEGTDSHCGAGGFVFQCALEGHTKAITGISLPLGSDKLYTGSADGSVRIWDCNSGKCVDVIKMEGKIGCMITHGHWVFFGVPKSVEVWDTQTGMKLRLRGPSCLVNSLTIRKEMLFAGVGDGRILAWSFHPKISVEPVAILSGHERPVISLSASARGLFSGSLDKTIKVWDLTTLECVQTISEHKAAVTSVLCWDQKLLSCSLDKTVKVWTVSESGALQVQHNHAEDHGLRTIFGMHRVGKTPVLFCSLHNSNRIRMFNLPSFSQRGTLFCKKEVRTIELADVGLLFTGDCAGELKIWRWVAHEQEEISEA